MSVAFRRESDEEHLEPRFARPIPPGPNLVTPEGRAMIEAAIGELEMRLATGLAGDDLTFAKRDLVYWQQRLTTATVPPPPPPGRIGFGSRVRISLRGKEQSRHITGSDEAAASAGKLAFTAPLAQAMMGTEEGDFVDFQGAREAIEILSIA